MTEAEVATVEAQLGVGLPKHYRDFLLEYPQILIDTKLDLGWVQEAPADRELCNNASRLVELNRLVRFPGTRWVGKSGDPWPDNYFVIGDDDCGDYWSVDLQSGDSGVWFYDHEIGGFERKHNSLQEFSESLLKEIDEFNREQ